MVGVHLEVVVEVVEVPGMIPAYDADGDGGDVEDVVVVEEVRLRHEAPYPGRSAVGEEEEQHDVAVLLPMVVLQSMMIQGLLSQLQRTEASKVG